MIKKRISGWLALKQALSDEISQFKGEAGIVIKDLGIGWEFAYEKNKLFPEKESKDNPVAGK